MVLFTSAATYCDNKNVLGGVKLENELAEQEISTDRPSDSFICDCAIRKWGGLPEQTSCDIGTEETREYLHSVLQQAEP